MTTLEELIKLKKKEPWEKYLKEDAEIGKHFLELDARNQLIVCKDKGKLIGYCEYSRLNLQQFAMVILTGEMPILFYDQAGIVLFVTNIHIDEKFRGLGVIKYLRRKLFELNPATIYICGQHQSKRLKPIAVFKRRLLHGHKF